MKIQYMSDLHMEFAENTMLLTFRDNQQFVLPSTLQLSQKE